MMPASLDRAYVLHQRRYTDSRLILDFLTLQSGVVRCVARTPGKRDSAKYQPFHPLSVEYVGSSDLKTLRVCEQITELCTPISGTSLFCALYVNELIQRLFHPGEAFPHVFVCYEHTLLQLKETSAHTHLEAILRRAEFFLLSQLGYAIDFVMCSQTGAMVTASEKYRYEPGAGFYVVKSAPSDSSVPGAHLLALAAGDFTDPDVLKTAKNISRKALAPLLGSKPLKSRELFR